MVPPTTTRSHAHKSMRIVLRLIRLLGYRDALRANRMSVILMREDFGQEGEIRLCISRKKQRIRMQMPRFWISCTNRSVWYRKDRPGEHGNVRNLLPIHHPQRISVFTMLRRREPTNEKANLYLSHFLRDALSSLSPYLAR